MARGITAVRAALAGAEDRGDVHAYPTAYGYRLVIEVKAGEQTANPTMTQIRNGRKRPPPKLHGFPTLTPPSSY